MSDSSTLSPAVSNVQRDSGDFTIPEKSLPPYDKALGTRKILMAVLVISILISLICIGFGTYSLATTPLCYWEDDYGCQIAVYAVRLHNDASVNVVTLLFTTITTICTEGLGYIHATSLRWGLARDGRLEFNSNLRLFSATQSSASNGILANLLSGIFLIMCYAGASQMMWGLDNYVVAYSTSMVGFGFGLLGLSIITALGLRWGEKSGAIVTWNSDPLNTALACLHHCILYRRSGRSFTSAAQALGTTVPSRPSHQQPSARMTAPYLRHVTRALFVTLFLVCISACAIMAALLAQRYEDMTTDRWGLWHWTFISTSQSDPGWSNILNETFGTYFSNHGLSLCVFLLGCIFQAFSTLALHAAELVVNLRRDEAAWRKAYSSANFGSSKGCKPPSNVILGAISNKGSLLLLCLKPLAQWLYGLGFFVSRAGLSFNPLPLFALSGLMTILAVTSFISARSKPRGPLPSTFGHLQTLVDLIDNWGDGTGRRLWWGDKGIAFEDCWGLEIRRVGTSASKHGVSKIRMKGYYISI